MSTELIHTVDDLRRGATRPRAVVMTMGALHDGHAELIRQARAHPLLNQPLLLIHVETRLRKRSALEPTHWISRLR